MRWEYKTVKLAAGGFWLGGILNEKEFTKVLNKLGYDRWELVSAFDTNHRSTAPRARLWLFSSGRWTSDVL